MRRPFDLISFCCGRLSVTCYLLFPEEQVRSAPSTPSEPLGLQASRLAKENPLARCSLCQNGRWDCKLVGAKTRQEWAMCVGFTLSCLKCLYIYPVEN